MKAIFYLFGVKLFNTILITFLLLIVVSDHTLAQSTGDFKSNGTGGGSWNVAASWLTYNGTAYIPAAAAPSATGNNIIIQAGDVITITSAETLGADLTVNGTLTVTGTMTCGTFNALGSGGFFLNAGATLGIGSAAGISTSGATGNIQTTTRTFNAAANYLYTGAIAQVTGNGLPTGITGTITDNNNNTGSGLTLSQNVVVTSPGSFLIPSGGVLKCPNLIFITGSGNFNLNSGATLYVGSIAGISITASTGNIQVTGTKTFNAAANYTYYGTMAQVTGNALPVVLTGTITFLNTSGSGSSLTNSTAINAPGTITVTGALACGTSVIISGSGTFTLSASGILLTANAAGISATGASGSIQTAVINYNTNAGYVYYGSVAQVTGTGLPSTVASLNINNSSAGGVSLSNNTTMNGSLTLSNGVFCLNGYTFTIATGRSIGRQGGSISLCGGNLVYAGTVSVTYSGSAAITTGLEIPSIPSQLAYLTINGVGKVVTQGADITINNTLTMTAGTLLQGGFALNYIAGSRLIYNGTAAQTTGTEWPSTGFDKNITISNSFPTTGVVLNASKTNYSGVITVSSGGYLNSGSFNVGGTGDITVSPGGTFITPNVNGVSPAGAIQLTGTRNFATGSSYSFIGTSPQVTGVEMPALVANVTINNTAGSNPAVTLTNVGSGTLTVTGTLLLTAGVFDAASNNMNLTFQTGNTPISTAGGTLSLNTAASLQFGTAGNTTGNAFTLPNNVFTTSPVLTNLGINRINGLTLGNQNITLTGTLTLTAGVLDLAATTCTFQNGNTPVNVVAGSLTAGAGSSLQFGTVGNTSGNAFTLPNNLFTVAPTFTNLILTRTNSLTLGMQNITLTGALALNLGTLNIGPNTLGLNGTVSLTGRLFKWRHFVFNINRR